MGTGLAAFALAYVLVSVEPSPTDVSPGENDTVAATPWNEAVTLPHQPENVRHYKEEAGKGVAWAQSALGYLYFVGRGVPQDYAEALKWYKKSADQGGAESQNALAVIYLNGQGVQRDYSKAYFWANLAVTLDPITPLAVLKGQTEPTREYIQNRDAAAAKLTGAQLTATQKRCRQWLEAFRKTLVCKPYPKTDDEDGCRKMVEAYRNRIPRQ
jgi:hypothetical protein